MVSKYLPEAPNRYSSKEGAQEAHEAIRPSDVTVEATSLKGMERDAERLYELIRRQFLACQMMPALYTSTRITVTAGEFELSTKGRILRFDGYTRVLTKGKADEDVILPDVRQGDTLKLEKQLILSSTLPSPRRVTRKLLWLKSLKNEVLAVLLLTYQLFRLSRTVVT